MCLLPYNDASPESIETFAKGLIGKTFKQILLESKDKDYVVVDSNINYDSASMKGNLGNLLEEKYFGYKANSDQEADFPKCGVELKATCFETKKNGKLSAGERLVLTMISYEEEVEEDFYKSHVWDKCRLILLIYYERNKALQSNLLYKIHFANLISPAKNDLPIIIDDYNKIIGKIKNGKAETISESDTLYLGACTKGATSAKSLRPQFYGDHSLAPKRAFCFKRQYMDYILNTYIIPDKTTYMLSGSIPPNNFTNNTYIIVPKKPTIKLATGGAIDTLIESLYFLLYALGLVSTGFVHPNPNINIIINPIGSK